MLNIPCAPRMENLECEVSSAHHGSAPALDIPELGGAEGPGPGNGFFNHAGKGFNSLFG